MSENPWWQPAPDDTDPEAWGFRELPEVITLSPDYGAELPLWGDGLGSIAWQYLLVAGVSPGVLDRLAAWQSWFDAHFRAMGGWDGDASREWWAGEAGGLAAAVRAELGGRVRVVVRLWPLGSG